MINKLISDFFAGENIKYFSSMNICECSILYPKKLPDYTKTAVFFLIPYYVKDDGKRNLSLYAVPKDYHLYVKELSERFGSRLDGTAANISYRFFTDNSPFCERTCAEKCGIGKRGKNGLIINPEYGSFVFIGSLCLSSDISISQTAENFKSDLCENCEKCKTFCPIERRSCSECLSAITQKKKISDPEAGIIAASPIKWGCDICQLTCPYNSTAAETPIDFFRHNRIPYLDAASVDSMSDDDFAERAYSWRGREVIKRNLIL